MKKAHWFIFFLLFAISCLDQPDCFRLNNNIIGISFRKIYDGKADTVAVIGARTLNLNASDTTFSKYLYTQNVYLPLDFFATQTEFRIESLTGINHLLFKYDVKTQFVSDDCGARYVLSNLSITKPDYDYDSVLLVSTTPYPSQEGVHLYVYRCPRTNLMKLAFRQLQAEASVALTPKIEGISSVYTGAIFVDTTLSTVNLPLDPGKTEAKFDFNFRDYGAKFFNISYASTKWDYKEEHCKTKDLRWFHDLGKTKAEYDFDSLLVFKDSLQDPPVTNIVAYRCPDMGFVRIAFRTPSQPVGPDSLEVVKVTAKTALKDSVIAGYQNVNLSVFTLPLIGGSGITSTEFTFEMKTGPAKKLTISYTQDSKQVFGACGIQTTFNGLNITAVENLSTQVGSSTATPKVDHTTFPITTNFEIIK